MSPHRTPHERLFQFLFAHARHAHGCVRSALPVDVAAALDWDTFAVADEGVVGPALRLHRADAVFALRTRDGRRDVLVLVEHKAWTDDEAEGQLLRYAVHLRRRAQRRGVEPPLIVAVLLQHGVVGARRLVASVGAPFADRQPRLPVVVDDLSAASEADVRGRGLTPLATLVLLGFALPGPADRATALAALERWSDLLRALDADDGPPPPEDVLSTLCWHLADTTELTKEEIDMTVARKVVLDIAYLGTGGEKARQQWFAEGKAEGKAEGLAETLLRQLARRFGVVLPDVVSRAQAGSLTQLQSWLDRVLDARDVAAVFVD